MLKLAKLSACAFLLTTPLISTAWAQEGEKLGLGRTALEAEINAWNVDVSPDGTGLPKGSGDAIVGEGIYSEKCAACHGEFAEGVGNWPKLAGGDGSLADKDPLKTVGSYWPYASTLFDYVHRSMPFGDAQSLSPDEAYAITAYVLYSNYIIEDDFVLSDETFSEVVMPNADGFIIDDREEAEYAQWRAEPCMENCKESVEITMRATVLDVTPDEGAVEGEATEAPAEEAADETSEETAQAASEETADAASESAGGDAELIAKGETVFKKCKACHKVGDGAKNGTGPQLNGVIGRPMASVEGFKYSKTLIAAGEEGRVWSQEEFNGYLADPKGYMTGTKMSFAGLKKEEDIQAVSAYLSTFSQ